MQLRMVVSPKHIMTDLDSWHFNVKDEVPDMGAPSFFVSWQKSFFMIPTLRWHKHADKNELHCQGLIFGRVPGFESESGVRGGACETYRQMAAL
jgi:hypothetical protein